MSYIEKNLIPNEKIVYTGKVHNYYIISSFIIAIYGFSVLYFFTAPEKGGLFNVIIGGLLAFPFSYKFISYLSTEIIVTNRRILYKTGIIARDIFELQINKIESAILNQTIFQRVIGSGTLIVSGTGGNNEPILKLSKPMKMKTVIYKEIDLSEEKKPISSI